ncbi:MAG: hypothetical protein ACE5F3_08605, partial [Mariprofundaceae bacterium]
MSATEPETATAQPPEPDIQARLFAEQVSYLYQQLPAGLYGSLAVVAVLDFVLWDEISHPVLMIWTGIYVLVTAARLMLQARYTRISVAQEDTHHWCMSFIVGACIAGIVWGAAGYFLMSADSLGHQMMVLLVLAGVLAVASQSLAAVFRIFVVFAVPALLPAIVWLSLQDTPVHLGMALMASFFLLVTLLLSRRFSITLYESFRLRFENIDLIS